MVKVMADLEMFKQGAYPKQKGDGLYMDGVLLELTTIFARQIIRDNQFLGLCSSSTFGVRTGKSTLMQQLGKLYTYLVNQQHGLNLKFDHNNIVFNTEDLEKRAYKMPRYSCVILDEGEGLDEHAMSKTIKKLQKFLRRSGQLNLFILVIMPDFFDIPKFLAMSRSNFLIDVKFEGEFERGYFEFYNFTDKKRLYVKGKKYHDYDIQKATLRNGRFVPMYCVDEEKYRQMKMDDLRKRDENELEDHEIDAATWKKMMIDIVGRIYPYFKEKYKIQQDEIGRALGIPKKTVTNYYREYKDKEKLKLLFPEGVNLSGETSEATPPVQDPYGVINHTVEEEDGGGGTAGQGDVDGGETEPELPPESTRKDLNNGVTIFNYET